MKKTRELITGCVWIILGIILSIDCRGHRVPTVYTQMSFVKQVVEIHAMTYHKFPDSLDELLQSIEDRPPLLTKKEYLLDLWGEPFRYECEGLKYVIISSGPDRKMGTADDIFDGYPKSYVESWKTRHAQAVAEAETNRVQEATSETVETAQPPVGVEKTQASRVPVTNRQHTYESIEPTPTWKILLCVGAIVVGVMAVWRCFRKGKQESGIITAIRFILECIAVFLAIIVLCVVTICAYSLWEDMRYPRGPGIPRIRLQISEIEKAVEIYAMIHQGKLPASLDDLIQGTEDNPPLLKKEAIIDPWGEPFEYKRTGRNFTIRSSGPDRQMGTEDDVTN